MPLAPRTLRKIAMPLGRPLLRIESLERAVAEAVQRILVKQAEVLGLHVEQLTQRLGRSRIDRLLEDLDWDADWEAPLRRELAQLTRDVLVQSGSAELDRLGLSSDLSFRLDNPRVLQHGREYIPDLVREVTDGTKAAIRDRLAAGFDDGRTTRQIARQIREVVGLTSRQAGAVTSLRQQLEEQGIAPEKIDRQTERYQQRLLRERATMIANTETIRAHNAGIQAAWEGAASDGLIDTQAAKRFWSVAASRNSGGRACEICTAIAAKNAKGVGLNAPFVMPSGGTIMLPPAHPRCRCGTKLRF